MSDTTAFAPLYTVTGANPGTLVAAVTVAATTASQAAALPPGDTNQIQIANQSTGWASVNFGVFGSTPAVTAATGYPVAPGAVATVSVPNEVTGVTVLSSVAGNVTFTRGTGK